MEITPSTTISNITVEQLVGIIKDTVREVTNGRFDAIESGIARLEVRMDKQQADTEELKRDMILVKSDTQEIKDHLHLNQYRFGLIESMAVRHDRQLEELAA